MKIFIFLVVTYLAIAVATPCQATLVVGVPNREGMLIVSDKLGHDTLAGYTDDFEKVVRLSPSAAVAVTGSAVFSWEKPSGTNILQKDHLSAWDLAKSYFSTNLVEKFNGQHFANCMGEQLSNYFTRVKLKFDPADGPGCQFIIFRTSPSKECQTFVALLLFSQTESGMSISTSCQEAVQAVDDQAQILAFGNAELPLELTRGHDPRFDDIRNNPILSKFVSDPPRIKKVKLADAQIFARKLMAEASTRTKLLNPSGVIGTNIDETILRFPKPIASGD